jgi:hypothetical protein
MLTDNRLHLLPESPCIGAGDPASDPTAEPDLDGEPRADDGAVDMGADEFLDQDDDGLPNGWEQEHFGSQTAGEPAADDDDDGLTSTLEYTYSRDPWLAPNTYYVDPAGNDAWDGQAPAWDGGHLLPGSPAVDAGDPADDGLNEFDLDGEPRVLCGRVDMGAYEVGFGDVNCDGVADLTDYAAWHGCVTGPGGGPYAPGCEALDAENDGDVDLYDFVEFQTAFDG